MLGMTLQFYPDPARLTVYCKRCSGRGYTLSEGIEFMQCYVCDGSGINPDDVEKCVMHWPYLTLLMDLRREGKIRDTTWKDYLLMVQVK